LSAWRSKKPVRTMLMEKGRQAARLRCNALLTDKEGEHPLLAPPYLEAGDLIIGQTADILLYLGAYRGLAPPTRRAASAHELQLTIADFVDETRDTCHPIPGSLYYEDERPEAGARTADFLKSQAPQILWLFRRVLRGDTAGMGHLVGAAELSYPDLSLYQVVRITSRYAARF
jgi:glutathione S-transferase